MVAALEQDDHEQDDDGWQHVCPCVDPSVNPSVNPKCEQNQSGAKPTGRLGQPAVRHRSPGASRRLLAAAATARSTRGAHPSARSVWMWSKGRQEKKLARTSVLRARQRMLVSAACQHSLPAQLALRASPCRSCPHWSASTACQHGLPARLASTACQHWMPHAV